MNKSFPINHTPKNDTNIEKKRRKNIDVILVNDLFGGTDDTQKITCITMDRAMYHAYTPIQQRCNLLSIRYANTE